MKFNPLPLRLCCLAAMAPALTSDAASRARDKVPNQASSCCDKGASTLDGISLVRGLTCQTPHFTPNPKSQTRLADCLQPKLVDRGAASSSNKLLHLGAVPNLAEIFRQEGLLTPTEAKEHCPVPLLEGKGMNQPATSLSRVQSAPGDRSGSTTPLNSNGTSTMAPLDTASQPVHHRSSAIVNLGSSYNAARTNVNSMVTSQSTVATMGRNPGSSAQGTPLSNGINTLKLPTVSSLSSLSTASTSSSVLQNQSSITQMLPVQNSKITAPSVAEMSAEIGKRQKILETRQERLLKRLRRLQSRQSISHVKQQMCGFVETTQQNFHAAKAARGSNPEDFKAELLQNKDVKNLSTAALVSLVQKLQASQSAPSGRQRANSRTSEPEPEDKVTLEEDTCLELDRVSGHLQSNLRHLETAIDSDATESSSGGESCDEMDVYEEDWDGNVHRPSVTKRAEWLWANDRAAIASRWTWLQAQVSDLEYRIRQQNDIYRQIRAGKGGVVLGDTPTPEELFPAPRPPATASSTCQRPSTPNKKVAPSEEKVVNLEKKPEMSPANISTMICNVDKQSSRLTQQLGNVFSPQTSPMVDASGAPKTPHTPNGFVEPGPVNNGNSSTPESPSARPSTSSSAKPQLDIPKMTFDPPSPATDATCIASRCRPVKTYRKRKLLKTAGLHQYSRKAAKLCTVRCNCYPPVTPCALCSGRLHNVMRLDPSTMSVAERVALLDPSYHPVLSFQNDIPLSLHFECLLKSGDWQQKAPPKSLRMLQNEKRRARYNREKAKKYAKRMAKNNSAMFLSSAKIRSKYEQKQLVRSQSVSTLASTTPKKPRDGSSASRRMSSSSEYKRKRKATLHSISGSAPATPGTIMGTRDTQSPLTHSGSQSNMLKEMREVWKKRRGESAYDINNIVIPYSIAASTRVERLKYKEIETPKWRLVDNNHGKSGFVSQVTATSEEIEEALKQDSAVQLTKVAPEVANTQLAESAGDEAGNVDAKPPEKEAQMQTDVKPCIKSCDDSSDQTSIGDDESAVGVNAKEALPSPVPGCRIKEPDADTLTEDTGESEMEDLSDEAYTVRHLQCEVSEKKRFAAIPTSTSRRGRGANIHKNSESGRTTPDPTSPECSQGAEAIQIPTPPCTPATMASKLEDLDGEGLKRCSSVSSIKEEGSGRRRTGSVSSRSGRTRSTSHSEERNRTSSAVYEDEPVVPPWPPRQFPLNEEDQLDLLRERPSSGAVTVMSERPGRPVFEAGTPGPGSPIYHQHTSESDEAVDDDPNDPEWTVVSEQKEPKIPKPNIVLKLAKR